MSDKIVYLVYENYDNLEDYEDLILKHDVMAVCTNKEIAEQIVKKRREQLLTKKYESYFEWIFEAKKFIEHKVASKIRCHDDLSWDIFVGAEDEFDYAHTSETGIYSFEIIEYPLNEKMNVH